MSLVLALALASSAVRPFSEERLLLDRRLAALRRVLPDGPTASPDVAHVRELAALSGLTGADAVARAPVESGDVGTLPVDVTAVASYADLDRFFRQLALSARLIDVESLSLTAAPEALVHLRTVLQLPFRPAGAPLPAAPADVRANLSGVPRGQADRYLHDQALVFAKSETIARLRRDQRNPRLFLAELAAISREHPVAFTEAVVGERFQVRGLVLGEGPSLELEARFERGFFRMSSFVMVREGACRRFEAIGRAPVVGLAAELPLPTEDPFRQDDAPCRIDRDASKGPEIPRRAAGRRDAGGPLSLRLRDVDLADVFLALHLATGESFVVDSSVVGRVDVELNRVELDDALEALRKAGLRISEGPVRRVALGGRSWQSASPQPGLEPSETVYTATFAVKRGDVRELLAVMTEADPLLASLGPEGFLGRASVWATNAPLMKLRSALLDVAGLTESVEDGRRVLSRGAATGEASTPVASASAERRLSFGPEDVQSSEFELAGLASGGSGWVAFAYAPTGVLFSYRAGSPIFDGTLRAAESTDVVLDTIEGPLRVALPVR